MLREQMGAEAYDAGIRPVMKMLAGEMASILAARGQRPRIGVLIRFLLVLALMVTTFAVVFKLLMAREGQEQTWVTAFYWVLTVMSTKTAWGWRFMS